MSRFNGLIRTVLLTMKLKSISALVTGFYAVRPPYSLNKRNGAMSKKKTMKVRAVPTNLSIGSVLEPSFFVK